MPGTSPEAVCSRIPPGPQRYPGSDPSRLQPAHGRGPGQQTVDKLLRVAEAIAQAMDERSRRLEISKERVLLELARIALLDPGDLFDAAGNLLPIHAMPEDARRAIASP